MRLTTIALATAFALSSTFALAQAGGAAGGSAGGSTGGGSTGGASMSGSGTVASSGTTGAGSSTNGAAAANPNSTMNPSGNTLAPSSTSGSTLAPTGPGSVIQATPADGTMRHMPHVTTAGGQRMGAKMLLIPSTLKAKPVSFYRRQTSRPPSPSRICGHSQRPESAQVTRNRIFDSFQVWTPPPNA